MNAACGHPVGHDQHFHGRRLGGGGRLGRDGNFLRHRPDRGHGDDPPTYQSGDTLNFTNQNGISGSYSGWRADLERHRYGRPIPGGLAVGHVLHHQHEHLPPDRISIVAIDGSLRQQYGGGERQRGDRPPVVTPSGTTNTFTVGGSAVAVDSGVTVTSYDTDLTGATVTITNYQSGDTLNFTNQNGIIGSYSGGVLTLTGSATPAQYQAALQSVTFSTTSTNTTTRSLSIVAIDSSASPTTSNTAAESVNVAIATRRS